jgi:heme-degrading monooxygenase HmoA
VEGPGYARVSRFLTLSQATAEALARRVREEWRPFEAAEGFRGLVVLVPDDLSNAVLAITYWRSREDAEAAGPEITAARDRLGREANVEVETRLFAVGAFVASA